MRAGDLAYQTGADSLPDIGEMGCPAAILIDGELEPAPAASSTSSRPSSRFSTNGFCDSTCLSAFNARRMRSRRTSGWAVRSRTRTFGSRNRASKSSVMRAFGKIGGAARTGAIEIARADGGHVQAIYAHRRRDAPPLMPPAPTSAIGRYGRAVSADDKASPALQLRLPLWRPKHSRRPKVLRSSPPPSRSRQ